jgi:hypothetical protein
MPQLARRHPHALPVLAFEDMDDFADALDAALGIPRVAVPNAPVQTLNLSDDLSPSLGQGHRSTSSQPPAWCVENAWRYETMCGRPHGFKSFEEDSDGGSTAIMCPALLVRRHGRRPRWGSRSGPKQSSDFESHWFQRGLRIAGSTERHLCQLLHPGIHTSFRRRRVGTDCPSTRHRGRYQSGHPVVQSRPKPRGGSIARSSERSSSTIACRASAVALSC